MWFVIPGLIKPAPYLIRGNPVFSWIPAFAGMTSFSVINVVAYRPLRGIEKKYVSEFMNQCTKSSVLTYSEIG